MPVDLTTYTNADLGLTDDDLYRIERIDCPQCGGRTVWSRRAGPREQHRCSTCRFRAAGYTDHQIETFRRYAYYTTSTVDERVARQNEQA